MNYKVVDLIMYVTHLLNPIILNPCDRLYCYHLQDQNCINGSNCIHCWHFDLLTVNKKSSKKSTELWVWSTFILRHFIYKINYCTWKFFWDNHAVLFKISASWSRNLLHRWYGRVKYGQYVMPRATFVHISKTFPATIQR